MINEKHPQISVVVPIYNVEAYLKRCIDSILAQQDVITEIILVNDGSTDSSDLIAKQYARAHPSQITLVEKANGGLSDARNAAFSYCSANYVVFIDSDDYIEPMMLKSMYDIAISGNKQIVECNYFEEYPNKTNQNIESRSFLSLGEYLAHGRVVAWNKLYALDFLKSNNIIFPKNKLFEDVEFFYLAVGSLNSITEIGFDRRCEVHYVQRNGAITSHPTKRLSEITDIYSDIIDGYCKMKIFNKFHDEVEYRCSRNLYGAFFRQAAKIEKKEDREAVFNLFSNFIKAKFPQWKSNKYLKEKNGMNFYLRCFVHGWSEKLLQIIMRLV